jgi:hypothetical protein
VNSIERRLNAIVSNSTKTLFLMDDRPEAPFFCSRYGWLDH